jgi:hypothetical protein
MHDTESFEGVRRVFDEVDWPKCNFTHSAGLGVLSRDADLIQAVQATFDLPAAKWDPMISENKRGMSADS